VAYFLLFDLETSSRLFLGQVFSAHFQLVDEHFQKVPGYEKTWYGALSCLEIPEPKALKINKIRLDFLSQKGLTEAQMAKEIFEFLEGVKKDFGGKGKIFLTGFNAGNFDFQYLRTLLIRNGFNPCFYGGYFYLDLLKAARHLAYFFPEIFPPFIPPETQPSFRLERLSQHFGFLNSNQKQRHEVTMDVELTRLLLEKLNFFCLKKNSSIANFEFLPALGLGEIFVSQEYHQGKWVQKYRQVMLEYKTAYLLLDLEAFQEKRDLTLLRYKNRRWDNCIVDNQQPFPEEFKQKSALALKIYALRSISDVYPISDCDIEQDIYRLTPDKISEVCKNVKSLESSSIKDLKDLQLRYQLKKHNFFNEEEGKNPLFSAWED